MGRDIKLKLSGNKELFGVSISKKSFWKPSCGELINKKIGVWLRKNGFASWEKRNPPRVILKNLGAGHFQVELKVDK